MATPPLPDPAGDAIDAAGDAAEPVDTLALEDPVDPDDEGLDPREAARMRRRDHDADAERRDLLRPGMGKVFKQIQDSWAREAAEDRHRTPRRGGRPRDDAS